MTHTSYIEISRSALEHNFGFIRELVGPDVVISSVVKGNAYGHGIEQFVPLVEQSGVRHFSVFSVDEAVRVKAVIQGASTVVIMGYIPDDQRAWVIENELEFFSFELEELVKMRDVAEELNKKAKVHIELETGMHRTGFSPKALKELMAFLKDNQQWLEVKGVCTHFAGAESIANDHRVKRQKRTFDKMVARIVAQDIHPDMRHCACSAAAVRYPPTRMELVRIGILQYGFFPSQEILIHHLARAKTDEYPLKRVISWKSKVMGVSSVRTGEFIGYGTSFLTNSDMKIAIIPIGYSHGFSRSLSNHGRVLIRGQRVGVVGTVNMNMISVDVTSVEGVSIGDEVVLIGAQGEMEISVASFSNYSDQLNYELLTRLPGTIPRMIKE